MKAEPIMLHSMKERHQPIPKLTIDDILEIARQIDKETGRYLSYGDVCTGIYAGRINPDDYLEKRRRTHDKRRVERGAIEQAACCGDNE